MNDNHLVRSLALVIFLFIGFITNAQNQALDLSGADNEVNVTYDLNTGTGFTVEQWVYIPSLSTGAVLVNQSNANFPAPMDAYVNADGQVNLLLGDGSGSFTSGVTGIGTITQGTWHHVAIVYSPGSGGEIFVDGNSVAAATVPLPGAVANTGPIRIGRRADGNEADPIYLDEVRIWSIARDGTAISADYNQELIGNEANLDVYLRFENDLNDDAFLNLAQNGSVVAGSIDYTAGAPIQENNYALSFDGVDEYVDTQNSLTTVGDFTLEAWVNASSSATSNDVILGGGDNWWIGVLAGTGGVLRWSFGNDLDGSTDITDDTWHHVAVSYNSSSGESTVYLDGAVEAGPTVMTGAATANVYIGSIASPTFTFQGSIDEVRVWNTVRSQAQINAFKDVELNAPNPGLVSYYDFSDGPNTSTLSNLKGGSPGLLTNMEIQDDWVPATHGLSPAGPLDTTNPTASITSTETDPTASSTIPITVTFSEEVVGFDFADISIGNGTPSNLNSSNNITFTLDVTPSASGLVTVDVLSSSVTDLTGNFNDPVPTFSINYDLDAPFIIASSLSIDGSKIFVEFNEDVFGAADGTTPVDVNDFDINTSGGTATVTKNAIAVLSPTEVEFDITINGAPDGAEVVEVVPATATSVYDFVGNTMSTTQISNKTGLINNSTLNFDGVDNYVRVPSNAAFQVQQYTLEAWVNIPEQPLGSDSYTLISKGTLNTDGGLDRNGYSLLYGDMGGGLAIILGHHNGLDATELVQHLVTLNPNQWYHVAASYDGTTMKVFLDGTEVGSNSSLGDNTVDYAGDALDLKIGGFEGSSVTDNFRGQMDEVRIWNYARDETQISALKDEELSGTQTGLVAYYDFGDAIGTSLGEIVAGRTGTLTGFDEIGATGNWVSGGPVLAPADITAPSITFNEDTQTIGTISISGTVDDNTAAIEVSLDAGTTRTAGTNNGDGTWEYDLSVDPNYIGEGFYNLIVYAVDAAENEGSTSGNVTIDLQNTLAFDGVDDYVEVPDAASLDITSDLTIETWVKFSSVVNEETVLVSKWNPDDTPEDRSYLLQVSGTSDLGFAVSTDGTTGTEGVNFSFVSANYSFTAGRWYHIAGTYSPSNALRIYVNGELIGENTINIMSSIHPSNSSVVLGANGNINEPSLGAGNVSTGVAMEMDETRIWSIEKSQADIQADMFSTLTGSITNLNASYTYDYTSGTTLSDDGSLGNNGALNDNNNGTADGITAGPIWGNSTVYDADVIAPFNVSGYPLVGNITETGFDITTQLSEIGVLSYVVLTDGAAVPGKDDIRGGTGFLGAPAEASGTINVSTPFVDFSDVVSGLSPSTNYDVYMVAEDLEGVPNVQINVDFFDVTTNAAPVQNALDFDGTDDYVIGTGINLASSDFTVEAWFNTNDVTATQSIFSLGNAGTNNQSLHINLEETQVLIGFFFDDVAIPYTVPTGWNHIAVTHNATTRESSLYINGQFIGSGTHSGNFTGNTDFTISRNAWDAFTGFFNGQLDELRVWNDIRSETEIAFNRYTEIDPVPESNLVAYYQFNEASGTLLPDSKNSNDGTWNGSGGGAYTTPQWIASTALDIPPYIVTNTNDSGTGSLRDAITHANANPGTSISFLIGEPTPWQINLSTPLPSITAAGTIIDGSTQPGWVFGDQNNMVTINGSSVGTSSGIEVSDVANVEIYGLIITGFSGTGSTGAIIINGENADGAVIGAFDKGNIIHGNTSSNGIYIVSGDNATIQGNWIGTLDGTSASANGHGIRTTTNVDGLLIGGDFFTGEGNVISGAGPSDYGIQIVGSDNVDIRGNLIGTNATGTGAIPNLGGGISLESGATFIAIGGPSPSDQNIISGNNSRGIYVQSATDVDIDGNLIGLEGDGISPLGNTGNAILLSTSPSNINIGLQLPNKISYNDGYGIFYNGLSSLQGPAPVNEITCNTSGGIGFGSTPDVTPPTIDTITPTEATVSTTAADGSTVTVWLATDGCSNDQGVSIAGTGVVSSGQAVVSGSFSTGEYYTAYVEDVTLGTSPFSAAFLFNPPVPISPTNLFTAEISGSQIDLSWTDNSSDETDFAIFRSDGNNSSFSEIGTTGGADITTYSDNTVSADGNYFYYVVARNGNGDSSPSNEKAAATLVPPGNGLTFDGVDDRIVIPDDSSIDFTTGDFSVSMWFYSDNPVASNQQLLNKGALSPTTPGFSIGHLNSDGNIRFTVGDGTTVAVALAPVAASTWYHVVGVKTSTGIQIYLNGVLTDEITATVGSVSYTGPMILGDVGGCCPYPGQLDEISVWSKALAPAEIANLLSASLVGNEANLEAYYKFDQSDAAITILPDRSANQNDGTLENFGGVASWGGSGALSLSPSPEIQVTGLGVEIVSGDITPDLADDTDFGDGGVSHPVVKTYTINNLGTADLNLGTDAVGASGDTAFEPGIQPDEIVPAGGSTTFTIVFTAPAEGPYNSEVQIVSDDADESFYTFDVIGNGIPAAPSQQVTNISVSNVTETTADISWTFGNGWGTLVAVYEGSDPFPTPVDNTTYIADAEFTVGEDIGGSGWHVVYVGTGTSVSVTGLSAGQEYTVAAMEFYGDPGSELYNIDPDIDNPISFTTNAEPVNHALQFDNTDYLSMGTTPITGTGAFTIEAWFNTSSPTSQVIYTTRYGGGFTGIYYLGLTNTGQLQFAIGDGTAGNSLYSVADGYNDGNWHHVTAVRETDGSMNLYIDGEFDNTRSQTLHSMNAFPLTVGRNIRDGGANFIGELDELALWTTALTAGEISTYHYLEIDPGHPQYGNLARYYQLNEGSGTTTADASGNGTSPTFNGTIDWVLSGSLIPPSGGSSIFEDFESGTVPSADYSGTLSLGSGDWESNSLSPETTNVQSGAEAISFNLAGDYIQSFEIAEGVTDVSFFVNQDNGDGGELDVLYSTDGGSSFNSAGQTGLFTFTVYEEFIIPVGTTEPTIIRIEAVTTNEPVYLDDITINVNDGGSGPTGLPRLIYFTTPSATDVYTIEIAGSTEQSLVTSNSGVGDYGIAYSAFYDRVYYIDGSSTGDKIMSVQSDGQAVQEFADLGTSGAGGYGSLALDTVSNVLYAVTPTGLQSFDLADGTPITNYGDILIGSTGSVSDIEVYDGNLFWSQSGLDNGIAVASLSDISGTSQLIVDPSVTGFIQGLTIDPLDNRLYWTTGAGEIRSANFDGSDESILVDGLSNLEDLEMNYENRHLIYVTDNLSSTIEAIDTEGTPQGTLLSFSGSINYIHPYTIYSIGAGGSDFYEDFDSGLTSTTDPSFLLESGTWLAQGVKSAENPALASGGEGDAAYMLSVADNYLVSPTIESATYITFDYRADPVSAGTFDFDVYASDDGGSTFTNFLGSGSTGGTEYIQFNYNFGTEYTGPIQIIYTGTGSESGLIDNFNSDGSEIPVDVTYATLSIPGGGLTPGSTDNLIYGFSIAPADDVRTIGVILTLDDSNYLSGDFPANPVKLWSNTTDDFGSAAEIGNYDFAGTIPEGPTVDPNQVAMLFEDVLTGGTTTYYYVTIDVEAGALVGNSLSVQPINFEQEVGIEQRTNQLGSLNGGNLFTIQAGSFDPPNVLAATGITSTEFTANWEAATGAIGYFIDVATDTDFNNILPDYEDFDAETNVGLFVSNLDFRQSYYYRVRADYGGGNVSVNSAIESLKTDIDAITLADSLALVQIYDAVSPQGLNWESARLRDWDGVVLNLAKTRVRRVDFPSTGAVGEMPNPFDPESDPEKGILDMPNALSLMNRMNISNNEISGLMDFAPTAMNNLNVSGNSLEFDDLEPLIGITTLDYTNQANIQFVEDSGGEPIKEPHLGDPALNIATGGTQNVYTYFRNGIEILPSDPDFTIGPSNTIIIKDIDYENMGEFSAEVTSALVPNLTISVDPQIVYATADVTMSLKDIDGNELSGETFDGALLETIRRTAGYDTLERAPNVGSSFVFNAVVLGDYLCGIEPENKDDFIPTYFGNAFEWELADVIELRANTSLDIRMTEVPPILGPGDGVGTLDGLIEEDFGDEGGRLEARRRAKQRKCGLKRRRRGGRTDQDDEFELIAYGETDDNGEFQFGFLPQGTYRFFVEYPGIPLDDSAFVEFEVGEAGVSDTDFKLQAFATEDGIEVTIEAVLGIILEYFKDLTIYPNPSSEYLNIQYRHLKSNDVTAQLVDLAGNTLWSSNLRNGFDGEIRIDVTGYEEGMYILRFYDRESPNDNVVSFRVIVKE